MRTDLSCCQALFDRDPVLYLDITEPVRRGTGTVLYAAPTGALVLVSTSGKDNTIYTLCASSQDEAEMLCGMIPRDVPYVTLHEECSIPAAKKRFGYDAMQPCWQVAYMDKTHLPLPASEFEIKALSPDHLDVIKAHYQLVSESYLLGLLKKGTMLGAFFGSELAGFIGCHEEGTMGLLEVLPAYRRRGVATVLQTHLTNQELSKGHIPYGQVFHGNAPSLSLQRSMGFTMSNTPLYWSNL